MTIKFYDYDQTDLPRGRSIFLAGPTTDACADGRGYFCGLFASAWRAAFINMLFEMMTGDEVQDLTVVVPEFCDKEEGSDWFSQQAQLIFGENAGRKIVKWEEAHMRHADIVVAWNDVRRQQPGLGLNARPELYGLMLRTLLPKDCATWAPKRLLFGMPPTAQAVSRFHELAEELLMPVHRNLVDLAQETASLLRVKPCSA